MGNQQPRPNTENLSMLCRNAILGDGYFWRHPECKNYKIIYTSTTPELLELKRELVPGMFPTGVRTIDLRNAKGRFPNAKQMYRLASVVSEVITRYKAKPIEEVIAELTIEDLALWYLDDGSTVIRKDSREGATRTYLYVGNTLPTDDIRELFLTKVGSIFTTDKVGCLRPNGSTASGRNIVWVVPNGVAEKLLKKSYEYGILAHKFPGMGRVQRPFRKGSRTEG